MTRALQPDVAAVLKHIASLELPPLETLSAVDARAFTVAAAAQRPPGPDVGEISDGELPGANSLLKYRLYRPATPGPHPVTVYFHGGGFVIGSHVSDDPICRQLCIESDSIIVSVDYRHAPENRFPAAHEDGYAAGQWISANRESLGGTSGAVVLAGWSAGGNIAAVVAQQARDTGNFDVAGQVLIAPMTSPGERRPSHAENAEGYTLTASLLDWFIDAYVDQADRDDPRVAPLRASNLSDMAPALVVTAHFDPLRDEGTAYAGALAAAGTSVEHLACDGHTHTSILAVGVVESAALVRTHIADAIRAFHQT
jgi:acetyl esterase/lipase